MQAIFLICMAALLLRTQFDKFPARRVFTTVRRWAHRSFFGEILWRSPVFLQNSDAASPVPPAVDHRTRIYLPRSVHAPLLRDKGDKPGLASKLVDIQIGRRT